MVIEMLSVLISLLLLELFSVFAIASTRGRRNIINALIIFHSLNVTKIMFLCVWSLHKTGILNMEYLQFPDEYYYLSEHHTDQAISNLYHLGVIAMKGIGFDISNIKLVNILLSSLAVVRLYTLRDLVTKKSQYTLYVFVFCGIVFLQMTYFSVFVLKDALFFYATAEFLVQLIRRPLRNRWYRIAFWATVLMLIRPPMVLGFLVFVFDGKWRFHWPRLLVFIVIGVVLMGYAGTRYRQKFCRTLASGVYEHTGVKRSTLDKATMLRAAERLLAGGPQSYLRHVLTNVWSVLIPWCDKDLTIQLILLLQWLSILYLTVVKKCIRRLLEWWPILVIGMLYFAGGVATLYNVRYNSFPVILLICLAVFAASGPISCVSTRRGKTW